MNRTTRRHGAWARVTRAWLVAMMIGIFALTLAGPASAASPPGGPTRQPVGTVVGVPPILQPTTPPVVSGNPGVGFFTCDLYQCITTVHVETAGRGIGFVIFDSQPTVATV